MTNNAFGKAVKKRLIDMDRSQRWLCEMVQYRTGMYFDSSYLSKLCSGKATAPKMVAAIKEILGLDMESIAD